MRFACLAVLVAGLLGCGGGGGGGDPLKLTLYPGSANGEFFQHELPGWMGVDVNVSGSTNADTIYVALDDSGLTIDTSSLSIYAYDAENFGVSFTTLSSLPPGTRTGSVKIRLCRDVGCGSVLGRASLPYSVLVKPSPPPELNSVLPDPINAASVAPGAGTTVTVSMGGWVGSATLYAKLADETGTFDDAAPLTLAYQSLNTYSLTLPLKADAAEGRHTGTVSVSICNEPTCADPIGTRDIPYSVQLFTIIGGALDLEATVDGPIGTSRFYSPADVTVDGDHNVYIAALNNFSLRKIDPAGNTSTVAAIPGHAYGVALGPDGTVLVTDAFRCVIRSVATDGTVTNIAGTYDSCQDHVIDWPRGLVADPAGGGYFVESVNYVVKKFLNGVLTVVAGGMNQTGAVDAQGTAARFGSPNDIVRDSAGNLFVTDRNNYAIRKIAPDGTVTTFAGSFGQRASVDGVGANARFAGPDSIAIDGEDNLYVADVYDGGAIRKITPAGEVTTLTRDIPVPGNGSVMAHWLGVSADGEILAFSDHARDVIVRTRLKPPAE